jgi:thioesterase domain-containing protein
MAEAYLEEVRKVQPNGPYRLVGYSGGGIVASEMARRLQAAGERVEFFAFLETWAPWVVNKSAVEKLSCFLTGVKKGRIGFLSRFIRGKMYLRRERGLRADAPGVGEPETIDLGPAFTAACERYSLRDVEHPILLIRAAERAEVGYVPEDLGWHRHARAGIEIVHVPGGHETMMSEPYSRAVAVALRSGLDQASGVPS